jgi:hypothetical protein
MHLSRKACLKGVGLIVAAALLVALGLEDARALVTAVVVLGVFLGLQYRSRWPRPARAAFVVFLWLATLGFGLGIAGEIHDNLLDPPQWDFLGFWLHARTAVEGGNFYDPRAAAERASGMTVSKAFRREIIDTGFWYPPPSMFLFWPLGNFDLWPALVLWCLFHVGVFAADVLLLRRIFLPRGGATELAACTALLAASHGTLLTFHYAQTNLVALLALLLFWRRRHAFQGGIWAAAGLFVKPFLAVLALGLATGRRWRAMSGFLAAVAVLALASVLAFGPRTCADYLLAEGARDKPAWVYVESTNQSLLGWVLRTTETRCSGMDCLGNPLFAGTALAIAAITLLLGARLVRDHDEWTIALYLLFALLVYPVSQVFYSVMPVALLLLFWRDRDRQPGGAWTVALLAATVYALCAVDDGKVTFWAFAVHWAVTALVGLRLVRAPAATERAS